MMMLSLRLDRKKIIAGALALLLVLGGAAGVREALWQGLDRRLARVLLEGAVLEGSPTLRVTHEAIGRHLGVAREAVTRMLRYFQEEGLVALSRGTVALTGREELEKFAQA